MRAMIAIAAAATVSTGLLASAKAPDTPTPTTTRIAIYATDRTTTTTSSTTTTAAPTAPTTTQPALTFQPRCPNLIEPARNAGFPETELEHLDYLGWRESRCDTTATGAPRCAHNADDPAGGSYGPWQINASWARPNQWNPHPAGYLGNLGILTKITDLCDWNTNARAAKALYDYSIATHGHQKRWWQWRT